MEKNRRRPCHPGVIKALFITLTLLLPFLPVSNADTAPEREEQEAVSVRADMSHSSREAGREVTAAITLEIPDGWYLYAHMMEASLAGDPDDLHMELRDISWPAPQTKHDPHLDEEVSYYDGVLEFDMIIRIAHEAPAGDHTVPLRIGYQACTAEICFLPRREEIALELTVLESDEPAPPYVAGTRPEETETLREAGYETATAALTRRIEGAGIGMILLISFLAGLGLSLTPCVYPMIPVTIAVIGASKAETRTGAFLRSLVYVTGISITYATVGVIAAASGAAFGAHLQHPYVYLALALLFFVFALAMFGLFEISLPMSWQSRLHTKLQGKAGLFGILTTGILSGIVVTSCAAPVVFAALGFIIAAGDLLQGFIIFAAIAWGMGVPLILAGTFGGMLNSLPGSGRWQQVVKNLMGLAMVTAALYFVYLSSFLSPQAYSLLLAASLIVISVFAGAFDRLSAESGTWLRLRKSAGILLLAGALYVIIPHLGLQPVGDTVENAAAINWHDSIEEGIESARVQEKPIMIYFSTDPCAACRQLERRTFPDSQVVRASESFATVKYDAIGYEEIREVSERFGVRGFPTIMFADSDGEIRPQFTEVGFLAPGDMLQLMEAAHRYFMQEDIR